MSKIPTTQEINTDITMSYVEVKDIHTYLKDYLIYLIDLHKHYVVCFNKKDHYDKDVLEAKITKLTERVTKLKQQLDKNTDNG